MKRSSASRSSVQRQTRLGCAPSSVSARIACGSECHGVVGRAAAQEDPHAGLEKIVGDVAVDGLVGVGHTARGVGGDEIPAIHVPAHRPAAAQRGGEDGVRAFVARGHGHKVHLLAERDGLRPAVEERADLLRCKVAASRFQVAAEVAGTVLGTVRKTLSGARRASSSIISMPSTSRTLPISCESQNTVVVPLRSAASAKAPAVIIELSMWTCGSTKPGAMMPPCALNSSAVAPADAAFRHVPAGWTAAIRPRAIHSSRSAWMRSV